MGQDEEVYPGYEAPEALASSTQMKVAIEQNLQVKVVRGVLAIGSHGTPLFSHTLPPQIKYQTKG